MTTQPGKMLRVHVLESDRWEGQPLYAAIVAKCRELGIAGATVFRGLEGFGETAELHRAHLVGRDQPIVIVIVDSEENVGRVAPAIENMMGTGVLATSQVEIVRVESARRE